MPLLVLYNQPRLFTGKSLAGCFRAASVRSSTIFGMAQNPNVFSMHWDNIPEVVLRKQREVFAALRIPLVQMSANRVRHGVWMNNVLEGMGSDEIVMFCDIDAFPLKYSAYEMAVNHAKSGAIFGLSQFSNHKKTPDTYAGPMFMAFRKSVWEKLGCVDMRSSSAFDAAEGLSVSARNGGVPLALHKPTACLIPKFALGHEGVFGIGTFYGENDFFHLFESRDPAHESLLEAVADDVVAQRPLQFARYLEIVTSLHVDAPASAKTKRHRGWFSRLFR